MGKAAEACLNAAYDNGDVFIRTPHTFNVLENSGVGTEACVAARGIGVVGAGLFGGSIMGDHGIEIASAHEKGEPGPSQNGVWRGTVWRDFFRSGLGTPTGLGNDPHPVPLRFQKPADQGRGKGRMIHIGVSGDKDEITFIPAPFLHIGPANGQKVNQGSLEREC